VGRPLRRWWPPQRRTSPRGNRQPRSSSLQKQSSFRMCSGVVAEKGRLFTTSLLVISTVCKAKLSTKVVISVSRLPRLDQLQGVNKNRYCFKLSLITFNNVATHSILSPPFFSSSFLSPASAGDNHSKGSLVTSILCPATLLRSWRGTMAGALSKPFISFNQVSTIRHHV